MSRNTGSCIRADQGPWRTTACDAYYFLLDADGDQLQKVVDDGLNSLTGGQRFRVTVDAVAMTFQQFNNMHVISGNDQSPILSYPETAFFIMISDTAQANRIYIWSPFMYCGDAMATFSGREVFGFPKEFSTIFLDGKNFSVEAPGLANVTAMSRNPTPLAIAKGAVRNTLFEITENQLLKPVDLTKIRMERHQEGPSGFWDSLGGFNSSLGQWVGLLIDPAIPFIFSRSQFSPTTGDWISQLLQTRSPVNQFSFDRFLIPLDFVIADTVSHPIVTQLGLVSDTGAHGVVKPLFACKIKLDFSLNPPQII
jgi:Acetoacetate decarboxylase (ADC)